MKSILLVLILMAALQTGIAQPAAFTKGKSTISATYGVVNIWTYFLKNAFTYPEGTYKAGSTGPFGLTYEFGFTNRISAGIALGYSEVKGTFNGFGYKFTEKLRGFTALARTNYHFAITGKKFDPYAGAGLGIFKFNYSNDTPGNLNSRVPGSFGYSFQIGSNYVLKNCMRLHAEVGYIGVGGSLGEVGINIKI